ncbi:MlaD family protein [Dinoroseobacter sp. S375]|uniref:MlaD family protein n=1 Tax=Dinoroseobacter sp. S375 TaxID=3415136 RepID=UPI003C7DE8B3
METRGNYILIGAFTLAGILGIMAFFLFFARVELDKQFAYYDINFASVSGLSNASDVRFSGLPVGQVVDVRLSPDQDGTIRVRIEVNADTPVRVDSVATIEAQGVTGVSFVGIDAGTPDAALLRVASGDVIPEITAGRSILQTLSEEAPQILTGSLEIVQEVRSLFSDDNRELVRNILENAETASEDFLDSLQNLTGMADTVTQFADEISRFNTTLTTLSGELTDVLSSANTTLLSIGELAEETKGLVSQGSDTLVTLQSSLGTAETYVANDLVAATEAAQGLMDELRADAEALSTEAQALMVTAGGTGAEATARLEELAQTIVAVERLVATLQTTSTDVGTAVRRIDGLIEEEGAPLVTETRAMVATATQALDALNAAATVDLPAIVADVRSATETATRVIAEVGADLSSAAAGTDTLVALAETTLADVSLTFRNANETLSEFNEALEIGDQAMIAAEAAFSSADRVLDTELSGIFASVEATLDALTGAVDQVSDELPEISGDLRAASAAAAEAFAALQSLAETSAPDVAEFTETALPLYTRLAQDARVLIRNLDQLTLQLERNPTRFFFDQNAPEFRR